MPLTIVFHETCKECNLGKMIHDDLYVWKCDNCGFSYKIDPAGKIPKITIVCRGELKKLNILPSNRKSNHKGVRC